VPRRARRFVDRVEMQRAQRDLAALLLAHAGGERLRLLERGARGLRVLQAGIRPAQPDPGERQLGVEPQGLIERARGLDPDV
jgi:hypothetical protein